MNQQQKIMVGRRNFLRVLCVGAGVAATPAVLVTEAKADSENNDEKRKARYKANSDRRQEPITASTVIRAEGGVPC